MANCAEAAASNLEGGSSNPNAGKQNPKPVPILIDKPILDFLGSYIGLFYIYEEQ